MQTQLIKPEPSSDFHPTIACDILERQYSNLIKANTDLNRQLVSFQANKATPFFRWFKYKEGFSRPLVEYVIGRYSNTIGNLLDPFAGAGSALFAARERGWKTTGIELLPVGAFAIQARLAVEKVAAEAFLSAIDKIKAQFFTFKHRGTRSFEHVRITEGAFPVENEKMLHAYLQFCRTRFRDRNLRTVLEFAAFSILESISFTRKDGQYLRWDSRAGRSNGSKQFDKGNIKSFKSAILTQLDLMWQDISAVPTDLFPAYESKEEKQYYDINLYEDSCLTRLRKLESEQFELILTSPPYCNRYDYTRTYALELAFLGANDEHIKKLRQAMLSCTVENKEKVQVLAEFYEAHSGHKLFANALSAFQGQSALQEILMILDKEREENRLNNPGIVRMIRNYFLEMSIVIQESARILKPGGYFVMVNDNVSYNGYPVPVDLILSEFARASGLDVEIIWKLTNGKGNSSQQMGRHGRREVRKCVYVWKKPKEISASL